jgi:hypothetical protein
MWSGEWLAIRVGVNAPALPLSVIGELQVQWKFPQAQTGSLPGAGFSQLLASVTASGAEVSQPNPSDQKHAPKDLLALPEVSVPADAPAVGKSKQPPVASLLCLASRKFAASTPETQEDTSVQAVTVGPDSPVIQARIVPVVGRAIDGASATSTAPVEQDAADPALDVPSQHRALPNVEATTVASSGPIPRPADEQQLLAKVAPASPPKLGQTIASPALPSPKPTAPPEDEPYVSWKAVPATSAKEEQMVQSPAPAAPTALPVASQRVEQQVLPKAVLASSPHEEQSVESPVPALSPNRREPALQPSAHHEPSIVEPISKLPEPPPHSIEPRHEERNRLHALPEQSNPVPKQTISLTPSSPNAVPPAPEPRGPKQARSECVAQPDVAGAEALEPLDASPASTPRKLAARAGRTTGLQPKPRKPMLADGSLPVLEEHQPDPATTHLKDAEQIADGQPSTPEVSIFTKRPSAADLPRPPRTAAAVEGPSLEPRPRAVDDRFSPTQPGFLKEPAADDDTPVQTAFAARLVPIQEEAAHASTHLVRPALVDVTSPQPLRAESEQVLPTPSAVPLTEEKTRDTERPHRPDKISDQSEPIAPNAEVRPLAPPTAAAPVENNAYNRLAEPRTVEPRPAARPQEIVPPREVTETPAPVRDIKLQFTADDGRIQVRMAERGGEVRVTVHASDQNVAGALRQDLPSLSGRLEQAGFHAETWHGSGAVSVEPVPRGESSAGTPQQDTPDPSQQNPGRQQQEQQQEHRVPEEKQAATKRSDDFSWLFESLR